MSNAKTEFVKAFRENIRRDGADKLLSWLENETDFFTAPASTRYHGAHEGGLVEHSLNVYKRLLEMAKQQASCAEAPAKMDAEKLAVAALLHDVCKVNYYKLSTRNQKNPKTGEWEKVPYYTVDDQFPYGHGEKSVYMIERFMRLTGQEALAIRWHMGGFDTAVKGGSYDMGSAFSKCKLAVLLHLADMAATYLDE